MDELIDTVETVEIVDGVRARLLTPPSVIETEVVSDSIVDGGEGLATCVVGVAPLPLVGEERSVGVGVTEVVGEEADDGVSEGSCIERGDLGGDARGDVWGSVWGDVWGSVWGDVWGSV